jgi:hypothetical protein
MSQQNKTGLIAHWPLAGDSRDHSGNGHALQNHGVVIEREAAVFNGRGAHLEIQPVGSLNLGRGAFTLSARIWIDKDEAEVIGDIASKFDPRTRTGFNFSVVDLGGVTTSSSNYRNLNFSIDAGTNPTWTDCGRPGNATLIFAMTVNNGELFAATFEFGDGVGGVYRYLGNGRWENTHLPCKANAVASLVAHDGVIYAGSGWYDARGSSIGEAGNSNTETRVWRMEKDGKWQDCGTPGCDEDQPILGIYRGRIYATGNYNPGLYRYDGDRKWTECAMPVPRFFAFAQWRGHLYAASNKGLRKLGPPPARERIFTALPDADGVYRYDDKTNQWTGCGKIPEDQMYCFAVHRGALYVGTWPSCKMFRSTTGIGWEDVGRFHPEEKEVMGVSVYNGMLYGGTLPYADVYRFDGDFNWTKVGNVDATPNVVYRRAWTMAVHDGQMFVGTLPSGRVHAMRAGAVASDSRELTSGWHDVAAVRDANAVRIYVDGQLRSESAGGADLDLTNDQALRIGFGAHDYFRGKMADVRLYGRALSGSELGQ